MMGILRKIVIVLLLQVFLDVDALPNCQHNEYVGGAEDNPICIPCPICDPGFGMNYPCGSTVRFPEPSLMYTCIPCTNGTFSSFKSSDMCDQCQHSCSHNQHEVQECTSTTNRHCECRPGIFEHGARSQCDQECCHCTRAHGILVNKCIKDDINGRLCAPPPGTSGKCPSLHTPVIRKVETTRLSKLTKPNRSPIVLPTKAAPTTEEELVEGTETPFSKSFQTIPGITVTTIHIVQSNEFYWFICGFMALLLILTVSFAFYNRQHLHSCQKRNRTDSQCKNGEDIWMDEFNYDSDSIVDAKDLAPYQRPLYPPPLPTSARPQIRLV